jgi:hypothetical protein
MSGAKLVVLGLWVLCIGAFFLDADSTTSLLGRAIFWVLVVAHAVECGVFLPVLRRAPGPLAGHLVRTFVFGIAHVSEVKAVLALGEESRAA